MNIVGVDIGGTSIKMGLIDAEGNIKKFHEYATESEKGGPYVIERLIEEIGKFENFEAIGVSTLGQIDRERGVYVEEAANIPLTNQLPLKKPLVDHFHVPVAIENDVNAAALGEKKFGIAKDLEDFLYVAYGTGIGGDIINDSSLYIGTNGHAGEFGHIVTHAFGRICGCGQHGCYEKYASTSALVESARTVDSSLENGRVIFNRYHAGDEIAIQLVEDWLKEIAVGLSSIIHIFNPKTIILGGGVMEQEVIVERLEQLINQAIFKCFRGVKLHNATLGNKAGILGAASLHMRMNKNDLL